MFQNLVLLTIKQLVGKSVRVTLNAALFRQSVKGDKHVADTKTILADTT